MKQQPQTRRIWIQTSEPQREDRGWSPLLLLLSELGPQERTGEDGQRPFSLYDGLSASWHAYRNNHLPAVPQFLPLPWVSCFQGQE